MSGLGASSRSVSKNFFDYMIYCAFLDPESISAVDDNGGVGSDHLIGVMRNLLESCFLAETSSWTVGSQLSEVISKLPDQDTRTKLIALLETFSKRDRFINLIEDHAIEEDFPLGIIAINQSKDAGIDIVITEVSPTVQTANEVCSIKNYNRSNFENNRQRNFANGKEIAPGRYKYDELFRQCFGRMLQGGDDFKIEDYMIGKEFSANYYQNLPFWCEFLKSADRNLNVTIITQNSSPSIIQSLRTRLNQLTENSNISFDVQTVLNPRHERFFRSTSFSLNIGRGIDLCDDNGMNRDICVRFAKASDIH